MSICIRKIRRKQYVGIGSKKILKTKDNKDPRAKKSNNSLWKPSLDFD